jgi:hypothetical protein
LELPELISTASQLSAMPAELLQEVPEPLPALPTMDLLPTENAVALPTLDSFSDTPQVTQESEVVPDTISDVKDFAWATSSYPAEQAGADSHSEHSESDAEILPPHAEESTDVERPALATLAPFLASLTSAASAREGAEPLDPLAFDSVPAFPAEFRSDSPEPEPAESPAAPAASQLDPAAIEAIAQRVIDRMQPKIIELVTRELLRPAVEALVQHELEKK